MSGSPGPQPAEDDAPARRFHCDGREWIVVDGGRSLTGTGHLAPARVRLIQFAHADEPGKLLLEITSSPRPVDELHDEELIELLKNAREVPVYAPPGEAATDGRRPRTGGPRSGERPDSRRRR